MSATPETITEKLHQEADRELRERIEKAAAPLYEILGRDSHPHRLETTQVEPQIKVTVYYRETFKSLKALAFEVHHQRNRDDAVRAFMDKVEGLSEQIEELKQSVNQ